MSQPDRIALPAEIHGIVSRWIVFFSLMSNDTEPERYKSLALMRRLSMEVQPCVGLEDLAQLNDYVHARLEDSAELSPLVVSEAWVLHCWLDHYSGDWLA